MADGKSGNPAKKAEARALARAKAEARASRDALDSFSWSAILHGKGKSDRIHVLTILDWSDDAMQCANQLDFRGWAAGALDDENFEKWVAVRPTIRDATKFVEEWQADTGEDLGESQAS